MYCRFCGSLVSDSAKFCPSCGKKLVIDETQTSSALAPVPAAPPLPQETAAYSYAPVPLAEPDVPQRGMKWFKFIIYFQLWVSLLSALSTAAQYLTGSIYDGSADIVYSYFPGIKACDMVLAILYIALGVYIVFVQRALAKYRAKGPKMYYILYAADIAIALPYLIAARVITGEFPVTTEFITALVVSAVMLLINVKYFNNRKHLFVNP